MSQPEFHLRYEQYPDDIKFELINGIVYMASPAGLPHGKHVVMLASVLGQYQAQTDGVEAASDATVILNDTGEPRPDLFLRVLPEFGGGTRTEGLYLAGPPELVIEIAHSTMAIDLYDKKVAYRRSGVGEYIVVCLEPETIYWFDLEKDRPRKLAAGGIVKSKRFPGLWIDSTALFPGDIKRLLRVLNEGLASPAHARFVRRLSTAYKTTGRKGDR